MHYQIINTKFQQKPKVAMTSIQMRVFFSQRERERKRVCVLYVACVCVYVCMCGVFVCAYTCVHVSVCVGPTVCVQTPYSRSNYAPLTVIAWGCMR